MESVEGARTLLEQFNNLPTLPKAVRDLLAEFERPQVDLDRVIALVRADPVISVKLLRLANSAFYHRSGSVSRIEDAVIFLGLQIVRNLVLAIGLAGSIKFPQSFPKSVFWRYCLHSAVVARYLAGVVRTDREAAFTLGLVRSIGQPLMYGALGDDMHALDAGGSCFYDPDRCALESMRLGFNHVELGADLAARWHFPAPMVEALRHSQASADVDHGSQMATIVQIAACVAAALEEGHDLSEGVQPEVSKLLTRVGLDEQVLAEMPPIKEMAAGLESLLE